MKPTPTENKLKLQAGGFATLVEALEYAAQGDTGFNFYNSKGKLQDVLTYWQLKNKARAIAGRFIALGLQRGSRVALIADTDTDFITHFFACQYAGLVPVPLPTPNSLGGRQAYEALLKRLMESCRASVAIASKQFSEYIVEAAKGLTMRFVGTPEMFSD
ncbi:MAG: AMP-binding protein, partial [Desulfobacterales bacterium]